MALSDKLREDMKAAMKAREKVKLTTIRGLLSEIKQMAIDEGKEQLTEEEEIAFLSKEAKQRRESIETFEEAGRDDLAAKEREELEIIDGYLPEQLSDEEAEEKVQAIIDKVGAKDKSDLGKVMGPAMQEMKGRYPGSQVKDIALRLLG
jgi:uncharacterized protein YqeY